MLIVCPSCATSYRVETACFGEAGRLVRCVRCGDVWLGTESLLVPAMIAAHEQAEIGAASAPDCEVESQERSTPDSSPDMEGRTHEADAFEPVAATTELQGDTPDDPVRITPESSEFAPQERACVPISLLRGPAPERWDAPALPAQIEAAA